MELLTINEAPEHLDTLSGKYVYVEGLLTFEFENTCVDHWPKTEQIPWSVDADYLDNSSIWISIGCGAFDFNEKILTSWNGKRVVVGGTLYSPEPEYGGTGHMSAWPAQIIATQIELLKKWHEKI